MVTMEAFEIEVETGIYQGNSDQIVDSQLGAPCAPECQCKLLIHGAHGAPYGRHESV
jgi:hypothetical protein